MVSTPQSRCTPTVVSFWPHPREVLHGDTRLSLDLPAEKVALLQPLGISQLVLMPLTRSGQPQPGSVCGSGAGRSAAGAPVAVGDNFRFGAGRRGDARTWRDRRRSGHGGAVLPMPGMAASA